MTTAPPAPSSSPVPAWLALLMATVVVAGCGGGGGGGGSSPPVAGPAPAPVPAPPPAPAPPPPAGNTPTIATAQPGDVLSYARRVLEARGPQAGGGSAVFQNPFVLSTSGTVSNTGTTVQEAGVDEDDLIKTAGDRIYTLLPQAYGGVVEPATSLVPFARLQLHRLDSSGLPQRLAEVALGSEEAGSTYSHGLMLAGSVPRLAVLAETLQLGPPWGPCEGAQVCLTTLLPYPTMAPRVHLQLFDVSAAGAPPAPQKISFDGRLIGTRLIGNMLYVVASHQPPLAFDALPATAGADERSAALAALTVDKLLPKISVNGGAAAPLVAETDCWLQPDNKSPIVQVTTVTAIDLAANGYPRSSRCFVGGTEALYMSPAHLYLATTRHEVRTQGDRALYDSQMRTDIHKFAISGSSIAYRASGSVAGHLGWERSKAAYRMSEHNGDLRVLSFTGNTGWMSVGDAPAVAPSPATLTVLREGMGSSGGTLQALATLPNSQRPAALGKPDEQVYAVRFLGARAYVVTFRQVDPLYVLDLTDPADPRTAGVLEVPGFSDWLFPVGDGLLFGVGRDVDASSGVVRAVKVALFDVQNAAQPRLLQSHNFGAPGSYTALDHSPHGLAQQVRGDTLRLALPMVLTDGLVGGSQRTLQRFEINGSTRQWQVLPAQPLASGWDIGNTRAAFTSGQVHVLDGSELKTWAW